MVAGTRRLLATTVQLGHLLALFRYLYLALFSTAAAL